MASAASADLTHEIVRFCHLLRSHGMRVSSTEVRTALDATLVVDLADREEFRLALRTSLTASVDDLEAFDRLFEPFWSRRRGEDGPPEEGLPELSGSREGGRTEDGTVTRESLEQPATGSRPAEDSEESIEERAYSRVEVLGERDFSAFDAEDMPGIAREIVRLARVLSTRRARRMRPSSTSDSLDLRHTMRRNLTRYGDTILDLYTRAPKVRRTRIVLLCDVSRSMDVYSRFLLLFVHALQRTAGRVESFVFGTRLTRVTPAFRNRDVFAAVERVAREVPDWSGGTRIGESLRTFVDEHGRRLDGRTVVVVVSDGLDTGEPEVVAAAMARIARSSARVVWLNPLLGVEGYQPRARGMAAALPYVDDFAPAHNLSSLRALVDRLERRGDLRPRIPIETSP